jgi:pyruvate/2-oxoglutarate/acetoin dehydrogenase E1 component
VSIEGDLAAVGELRVVVGSDAEQVDALVRAAAAHWAGEEPTLLLIPRRLLLTEVESAHAAELARPFACPQVLREGAAATVFAWGETVALALAAAHESGVDAAVVDVECLAPLDRARLVELAQGTGKIVIAHGGPRHHGVSAELAALFAEQAVTSLDAPILRVCGHAFTSPSAALAEDAHLPTTAAIADALRHVAHY